MRKIKVMSEIIFTFGNDYPNIDETIIGIEIALNTFYWHVLREEKRVNITNTIRDPEEIGLRFHFKGIEDINMENTNLDNCSIKELEEVLKKKKKEQKEIEKPKVHDVICVDDLQKQCAEYIDSVLNGVSFVDNDDHFIFRTAMETFYGKDVWIWINKTEHKEG